jgi:small ligand-binding sensory domain FIST
MQFRVAHAAHPDWTVAVEECLRQLAQAPAGERARGANLGFIYLTDPLAPHTEEIVALLKSRTGIASWVGASADSVLATGAEYVDEAALVVLVGRFAPGSYNVFSGTQRPPGRDTRNERGALTAGAALVHADPATPELTDLVVDMAGKLASGALFGGVAGGRSGARLIADRVLSGGLSGVVFASDVDLVTRVTQGVHPLTGSEARRITRATANLVVELDGRRAFDVLLEDARIREGVGEPSIDDAMQVRAQLQALGRRGLFVGLEPEGAARQRTAAVQPDYLVRHVIALDPGRGTVAIAGPAEAGQTLHFCTRDDTAARKDLVRICAEIRDHLHEQQDARGRPVEPRGALYFSCLGRGSHMFGEQGEELRLIQNQLGEVPLAGFFANGEIGGRSLYGYTGVLTVFY